MPPEQIDTASMPLNDWVAMFGRIYHQSQNHERSIHQLLLRLYEATLTLQKQTLKAASYDRASGIWLPKVFSWFCAGLRAMGITNLEALVWTKFPAVCPFCAEGVCTCLAGRDKRLLDRGLLAGLATKNVDCKPQTLAGWQQMFDSIYRQSVRGVLPPRKGMEVPSLSGPARLEQGLFKLYEELTELSEAVRLRAFYPGNLLNEAADVFACICSIANLLPGGFEREHVLDLGATVWRRYPDTCDTCRERICICRMHAVEERLSAEGIHASERQDHLTGLYNRRQYEIDRSDLLAASKRPLVAEIFFDCDDFKNFNETTPGKHSQGDEVLRHVARAAEKAVGEGRRVYRFAGDEFVVLLDADTAEEFEALASCVAESVREAKVPDVTGTGAEYSVTISVGVAIASPETITADELHRLADQLASEAKQTGKARVVTRRRVG